MLIKLPQPNIVIREAVLPTGEKVRAYFAVFESLDASGQVVRDIRFLGFEPVARRAAAPTVLMLAAPRSCGTCNDFVPYAFESASPYFDLHLLVNQLARAPSRR